MLQTTFGVAGLCLGVVIAVMDVMVLVRGANMSSPFFAWMIKGFTRPRVWALGGSVTAGAMTLGSVGLLLDSSRSGSLATLMTAVGVLICALSGREPRAGHPDRHAAVRP